MEIVIVVNGKYYAGMNEVRMGGGGLGVGGFGYTGSKGMMSVPIFTEDIEKAEVTWTPIDLSRKIKSITDAIKYGEIDMHFEKIELINIQEEK